MSGFITDRDKNNLKAGFRKAFARSELHHSIINQCIVEHSDPNRKQVKTWCRCPGCGKLDAKSYFVVDHSEPVVPLNMSFITWFDQVGLLGMFNAIWCDPSNLQALCKQCHDKKTKEESAQRRLLVPRKKPKPRDPNAPKKPRKKKACNKS